MNIENLLHTKFMLAAIALSEEKMRQDFGGPFGAVIVKEGNIIATGYNCVTSSLDPTAHAEIVAIRNACQTSNNFNLAGCAIYSSCEPCPMCLAAIYWARIDAIFYAATQMDAAKIGFDDANFYQELNKPMLDRRIPMQQLLQQEALIAFKAWEQKLDKQPY